jgi:hypothetical protein
VVYVGDLASRRGFNLVLSVSFLPPRHAFMRGEIVASASPSLVMLLVTFLPKRSHYSYSAAGYLSAQKKPAPAQTGVVVHNWRQTKAIGWPQSQPLNLKRPVRQWGKSTAAFAAGFDITNDRWPACDLALARVHRSSRTLCHA